MTVVARNSWTKALALVKVWNVITFFYFFNFLKRLFIRRRKGFFFQHCLRKNFSLAMAMGDIVVLLNKILLFHCLSQTRETK